MPYITPKTDWTASDFFNVDPDWDRIYNNARMASALTSIGMGTPIEFTPIVAPTTAKNPPEILAIINTLLANIEAMRIVQADDFDPPLPEIKDDWLPGRSNPAPNYTNANRWETTIDLIWISWGGSSLPVCPTLSADLTIPNNTQHIVVDCIDPDGFEIIIEGSGELFVI